MNYLVTYLDFEDNMNEIIVKDLDHFAESENCCEIIHIRELFDNECYELCLN